MKIEYHRTLIADRIRVEAFHAALKALIVPGETSVADIGCGTGLLGLLAMKLGAKEVFLYEWAEVAGVAAEVLAKNKARNCQLFPCASTEMEDPPQVDLVVSETLGNYALEEDTVASLSDARARHLKPGGRIIPAGVEQVMAPVTTPRFHEELVAWDRIGFGIDLSPARTFGLNNVYVRKIAPADLLSAGASAVTWDKVDFMADSKANRRGEARWKIGAETTVYGLAVWWVATLAPGVVLSTAPDAPMTHWEQLYFPFLEPLTLARSETLLANLRSTSSPEAGTNLAWTVTVIDKAGKSRRRLAMDLDKGYLP